MVDTTFNGVRYKLRAGTSMPVAPAGSGDFVLHTFMAEKNDVTIYSYTNDLPPSGDFRGQLGGASLMSANFNRLQDVSGNVFAGEKVHETEYIEEEELLIQSNLDPETFMECTSLSISYDIMGRATVSYVLISKVEDLQVKNPIIAGGQTFSGYISSVSMRKIPKTDRYENHVTLIATTD